MARHAAPRLPSRHRAHLLGGVSVLGLAAMVAVGVLVAPASTSSPIGLHWPATSPSAPSVLPSPEPDLVIAEPAVDSVQASLAGQALANQERKAEEQHRADEAAEVERQKAAAQAEVDRKKAADAAAAKQAAKDAAAKAAAAAAVKPAPKPAPAPAPAPVKAPTETKTVSSSTSTGSLQDYALQLLGGDASELAALEKLWGRESGWNPDAQNPSSTAYGIPQFLDSTWASTGIAKTSDPQLQIKAGLAYIESRYGSPSAAWAHSQSAGWY